MQATAQGSARDLAARVAASILTTQTERRSVATLHRTVLDEIDGVFGDLMERVAQRKQAVVEQVRVRVRSRCHHVPASFMVSPPPPPFFFN